MVEFEEIQETDFDKLNEDPLKEAETRTASEGLNEKETEELSKYTDFIKNYLKEHKGASIAEAAKAWREKHPEKEESENQEQLNTIDLEEGLPSETDVLGGTWDKFEGVLITKDGFEVLAKKEGKYPYYPNYPSKKGVKFYPYPYRPGYKAKAKHEENQSDASIKEIETLKAELKRVTDEFTKFKQESEKLSQALMKPKPKATEKQSEELGKKDVSMDYAYALVSGWKKGVI